MSPNQWQKSALSLLEVSLLYKSFSGKGNVPIHWASFLHLSHLVSKGKHWTTALTHSLMPVRPFLLSATHLPTAKLCDLTVNFLCWKTPKIERARKWQVNIGTDKFKVKKNSGKKSPKANLPDAVSSTGVHERGAAAYSSPGPLPCPASAANVKPRNAAYCKQGCWVKNNEHPFAAVYRPGVPSLQVVRAVLASALQEGHSWAAEDSKWT